MARCDPPYLRVSLRTVVERVEWRQGGVSVSAHTAAGEAVNFSAPKAIVTLPLGVLQANAVEFRPALSEKWEAVSKLAVGHVIRVTLRFRERFWEEIRVSQDEQRTMREMRFLFTEDPWYPTWWSTLPQRAPVLVGWAPAAAAEKLSGKGERFQVERAVQSLSEALSFPRERMQDLLERGYVHDWQADPFARGAYSYVKTGGGGAAEKLAEPVANTLLFAGEATDSNGYFGTVHGAIASGYRAVREAVNSPQ